jgi:hypothetical protein
VDHVLVCPLYLTSSVKLYIYIYIYQAVKYTVLVRYQNLLVSALGECCIGMINLIVLLRYLRRGFLGSEEDRY